MKEEVLDVLLYLFEHVVDDVAELEQNEPVMMKELTEVGFEDAEIKRAFVWLEELLALQAISQDNPRITTPSIRVFDPREQAKFDAEALGLLLKLEQAGVLDPLSRELVIDRALALDDEPVTEDDIKWVTLLILFNRPGLEAEFAWMEDFVYEGVRTALH